ncbi:peptidase, S9A/B/C family, catalytic domain protein [Ancylostoma duodenale]|uniref:Peptidase, S9A/B/C family, catalytic domain protein n=1 Tax=Ancylostoma duodenale TaxID=51022 RepID=A0A0C2D9Q5_9BILA|nr:peptidase, S9A/B/C family, catalytic domain protein [Ancylostoma duodenale]
MQPRMRAQIDGRGSNARGWKYRSAVYGALGSVEIDDQIEAIRQVMKKYPFLDDRRLFVFGWSYGGFAAALMAERAPEAFFKCTVSVAPVANFLYYDATYTERYMGEAGNVAYDASDITIDVSNFKKTRLLLVHGIIVRWVTAKRYPSQLPPHGRISLLAAGHGPAPPRRGPLEAPPT